jgi:hypothetical protein
MSWPACSRTTNKKLPESGANPHNPQQLHQRLHGFLAAGEGAKPNLLKKAASLTV